MAKSKESFAKKEREKKREKKKQEKQERKEQRKSERDLQGPKSLDDMLSYVDEDGNVIPTPPDPAKKKNVSLDEIVISVARRVDEPVDPVHTGKVNFFNASKGYGFIHDQRSGTNIFVHQNDLLDRIKDQDKVSFEVQQTSKGPAAIKVKLIK